MNTPQIIITFKLSKHKNKYKIKVNKLKEKHKNI